MADCKRRSTHGDPIKESRLRPRSARTRPPPKLPPPRRWHRRRGP